MRKRAALMRELRESLVDEALRDGKTIEQAEAYATRELSDWSIELSVNRTLRAAVQGCRV